MTARSQANVLAATADLAPGTWTVHDARAQFRARNFGWHTVTGTIAVLSGAVRLDADQPAVSAHVTLDPASIDTGHARRDRDLCGKRFLDVSAHPAMSVDVDQVSETADGWQCVATVRVAGAVAPVALDVHLESTPTATTLALRAVGRLDLHAVGITAPSFLVRRHVDLTITALLTNTARGA